MRRTLLLGTLFLSTSAQADEVWHSDTYGDVIYEEDFGEVALLSFAGSHPGHRVHMYVEGLGGNYDQRGVFSGYWIAPEESDCPIEVSGEDGLTSNAWGSVTIAFDTPTFPSSFTAQLANCFGEDMEVMRAIAEVDVSQPWIAPTGLYDRTDFGPIDFTCTPTGRCRGAYEDGQAFLYIEPRDETGSFAGHWAEPDANQACNETKDFEDISTDFWGKVEMGFDPGAQGWTGHWGYCNEAPSLIFDGARREEHGQSPTPYENEEDFISRLLGSWLPAPGSNARRNDMYTFNPDGTRAISDGSGMNLMGTWGVEDGQLTVESRPLELELSGDVLRLSGTAMTRATLWGEDYSGRSFDGSIDTYGVFAPQEKIAIETYSLHLISFAPTPEFQAHARAPEAAASPIWVEFWNEAEPIKRAESGNAYRNDTVRFEAHTYEVTKERLKFYGQHPEWGEIYFNGQREGLASDVPIWGDLMVKGFIFRDVTFAYESLH